MILISPEHEIYLEDPVRLKTMPEHFSKKLKLISVEKNSKLNFFTPKHLRSNTNKKAYKCGFLYEIYEIMHPKMKRKEMIDEIILKYDLFMENRAFYDCVKIYKNNKYSIFVIKKCI